MAHQSCQLWVLNSLGQGSLLMCLIRNHSVSNSVIPKMICVLIFTILSRIIAFLLVALKVLSWTLVLLGTYFHIFILQIYLSLEGVQEETIEKNIKSMSIELKFHDVKGKNYQFAIPKLNREIVPEQCKLIVKPTRVTIVLVKALKGNWIDLHYKEDKVIPRCYCIRIYSHPWVMGSISAIVDQLKIIRHKESNDIFYFGDIFGDDLNYEFEII